MTKLLLKPLACQKQPFLRPPRAEDNVVATHIQVRDQVAHWLNRCVEMHVLKELFPVLRLGRHPMMTLRCVSDCAVNVTDDIHAFSIISRSSGCFFIILLKSSSIYFHHVLKLYLIELLHTY